MLSRVLRDWRARSIHDGGMFAEPRFFNSVYARSRGEPSDSSNKLASRAMDFPQRSTSKDGELGPNLNRAI